MVCGKKEALREPGGERSSEAEAFCPIEATDAALVLAAPAGAWYGRGHLIAQDTVARIW